MRLYRIAQIHRFSGLSLGLVLLILSITGFFLNHDNFNILWNITFNKDSLPSDITKKTTQSFNAFKVNIDNPDHLMTGSRMGFFISVDAGKTYKKTLDKQVLAIEPERQFGIENYSQIFTATTDGVYQSQDGGNKWKRVALEGEVVESLSSFNGFLYAVVDKRTIYKIHIPSGKTQNLPFTPIASDVLPTEISLGRLVRDLHYGRGIFSGDSSLFINDFSALVLVFLSISGFVIYLLTKRLRDRKMDNKQTFFLIRMLHSNKLMLFSFVPILLLLITGVMLDHPDFFKQVMRKTKLETGYLTPVYRDLSTDIWGIDFDGENYRIGNRLGVFKSTDLKTWSLENKGFAWRMKRVNDALYVSGMGSPNRTLSGIEWKVLSGTAHMPRDFFSSDQTVMTFSKEKNQNFPLPVIHEVPLYYVLLSLHDGKFFHEYWVYINDLASLVALLLLITGLIKWRRRQLQTVKCTN